MIPFRKLLAERPADTHLFFKHLFDFTIFEIHGGPIGSVNFRERGSILTFEGASFLNFRDVVNIMNTEASCPKPGIYCVTPVSTDRAIFVMRSVADLESPWPLSLSAHEKAIIISEIHPIIREFWGLRVCGITGERLCIN